MDIGLAFIHPWLAHQGAGKENLKAPEREAKEFDSKASTKMSFPELGELARIRHLQENG